MNRRELLAVFAAFSLVAPPAQAEGARSTGVIFVGASWCPVCKQAAPMLNVFAQRHRIPVIVASHDARPIEPFPEFVDGRLHPLAAPVRAFPTTLVYSSLIDGVVGGFEGYRNPQWFLGQLLDLTRQAEGLT